MDGWANDEVRMMRDEERQLFTDARAADLRRAFAAAGARLASWRRLAPSWFVSRISFHALALVVVLAFCALGQYETLVQVPIGQSYPDTATYLLVAHRILDGGTAFDVVRTPGYPLFLACVFAFAGRDNLVAVVFAQSALIIITIVEIYAIAFALSRRRSVAAIAASAIATNTVIIQWERLILTETLAYFWVVACVLCLTLYMRAHHWATIVALAVSMVAALLTRPSLAFLPTLMFGALLIRWWYMRGGRLLWRQALVGLTLAYGLMGLYIVGNGLTWGYYGLSSVGPYNLFAKAFEYHLETNPGSDPLVAQMRADVRHYIAKGGVTVNGFYAQYPYYGQREGEGLVSRYARDVVLANPVAYTQDTLNDMRVTIAIPAFYYPRTIPGHFMLQMTYFSQNQLGVYSLWPFFLAIPALTLRRRREDGAAFVLLLLTVLALVNLALVSADAAGEFYRLRSIFDWAIVMAGWILACELVLIIAGAGSRLLGIPQLPGARALAPARPVGSAVTGLPGRNAGE
jgi:4-amino-4-deoxy-L-arabinose transferase-like glycosyltransferase